MSEDRILPYGQTLPATWLAAIQEFVGSAAVNFGLTLANPTTVQIIAGTNSAQVGIGIDGLWRYITTTITSAVTGSAGIYDIFVVCGPNDFVSNPTPPPPELDGTVYAFALQVLAHGTTPTLSGTVTNFRQVGDLDWSGSAITGLRGTVGDFDANAPISPKAPQPAVSPLRARGAASQTALLQTWETSAAVVVASVSPTGALTVADTLTGTSASLSGSLTVGGSLVTTGAGTFGSPLTSKGTGASAELDLFAAGAGTNLKRARFMVDGTNAYLQTVNDTFSSTFTALQFALGATPNVTIPQALTVTGASTLSGLTVTSAVSSSVLQINAPAGNQSAVQLSTAGVTKWQLGKQTDDSFFLFSNVAGVNVLAINIAGTATTITGTLTVSGAASTANLTAYAAAATNAASTSATNWLRSPKNTITAFVGDNDTTGAYGASDASGVLRFNGLGTLWGDLGYYPKDVSLGQFRLSVTATSLNTTPNASLGVGSLISQGNVAVGGVITVTGGTPGTTASLTLHSDLVLPQGAGLFLAGYTPAGVEIQALTSTQGALIVSTIPVLTWTSSNVNLPLGATTNTPPAGDNSSKLATTNFVNRAAPIAAGTQNGVLATSDAAVTPSTINATSALMNIPINGASPLYVSTVGGGPVVPVVLNPTAFSFTPTSLPAGGPTAFIAFGVDVDTSGTISVTSYGNGSSVAASLTSLYVVQALAPAGKLRLADVVITGSSGSYAVSLIRDRRPFAHGANISFTTAAAGTNAPFSSGGVLAPFDVTTNARLECTGQWPVEILFRARFGNFSGSTIGDLLLGPLLDGTSLALGSGNAIQLEVVLGINNGEPSGETRRFVVPANVVAGSHLFGIGWYTDVSGTQFHPYVLDGISMAIEMRELVGRVNMTQVTS